MQTRSAGSRPTAPSLNILCPHLAAAQTASPPGRTAISGSQKPLETRLAGSSPSGRTAICGSQNLQPTRLACLEPSGSQSSLIDLIDHSAGAGVQGNIWIHEDLDEAAVVERGVTAPAGAFSLRNHTTPLGRPA